MLAHCADDAEVVLYHLVVDGGDGAGCGVFDGEDAVAAHAFFNGIEDVFEAVEEEDGGEFDE